MKQRKKHYYSNYFKNNIKDMKKTWKGIKSLISLNAKESESPKTILNNKREVLTNPIGIASNFNKFFCSVAPKIQSNIEQTFKPFHYYLTNPYEESFLISPGSKKEIQKISNFDNNNKATVQWAQQGQS